MVAENTRNNNVNLQTHADWFLGGQKNWAQYFLPQSLASKILHGYRIYLKALQAWYVIWISVSQSHSPPVCPSDAPNLVLIEWSIVYILKFKVGPNPQPKSNCHSLVQVVQPSQCTWNAKPPSRLPMCNGGFNSPNNMEIRCWYHPRCGCLLQPNPKTATI